MSERLKPSAFTRAEVTRLIEPYLAVSGGRDRRLFEIFIFEGFQFVTLDIVEPEFYDDALLAKLCLATFIVLCDDLADNPKCRDTKLLAALYELNVDKPKVAPPMFTDEGQHERYRLGSQLVQKLLASTRRLPRGELLLPVLAFDVQQFYQANRYAELLSSVPGMASLDEVRSLGPHNMGMVAAGTIDLMAARWPDLSQLGPCREVFLLGQRAGRICNVLATYEREIAEGDVTNEIVIGARGVSASEYRRRLMDEFERLLQEIVTNERKVTAFDVQEYARGLHRLYELHISMRGII